MSLYDLDPKTTRRQREYDSQRATLTPKSRGTSDPSRTRQIREGKMPSSKGEPTDPELREKIKEEVKAEEKGGGKGNWSAWKAAEMARRYEAQGGDYKDAGDNKNKPKKGEPEKKESAK